MLSKFIGILSLLITFLLSVSTVRAQTWSIEDYRSSYTDIKNAFGYTNRILNFSGVTYLSEFDDNNGVYAGHLGNFWAITGINSVYSSHQTTGEERSAYWRNAYSHGLLFFNRDNNTCKSEDISSYNNGVWYPSKMVVSQDYTSPFVGRVTGTKMGITGYQGMAIKIKIENTGTTPLNLNILSYSMLNSIGTSSTIFYPRTDDNNNSQASKRGFFLWDNTNKVLTFSAPNLPNAYLTAGFDGTHLASTFRTENQGPPSPISTDFCEDGSLNNTANDSAETVGSEAGMVTNLPTIPVGGANEFTVIYIFGSTTAKSVDNFNVLKNQDLVKKADDYWNTKITTMFENVPHLSLNNPDLGKIYKNSLLNIFYNYFDPGVTKPFYGLGDKAYVAQFPWQAVNTAKIWTWVDKAGFKQTLQDFLTIDLTKCKARNPVNNTNYCWVFYSFDPSTLVFSLYDYLSITNDWSMLSENVFGRIGGVDKTQSVLDWTRELVYLRESAGGGTLVDFGSDNSLYEFRDTGCVLNGLYTGKVPTPNGERYSVHKKLAELYRKVGQSGPAQEEEVMAISAKNSLQELWNSNNGWFDTISLYDANQQLRTTPLRNSFSGVWIFHLLDYPGLLSTEQKTALLNHLPEYQAPSGFYSVSKNISSQWCPREDWQGPGIYIGELGRLLDVLFQQGKKQEAYQALNSLNYLKNTPYFAQCINGRQPRFSSGTPSGCGATAYLEGSAVAQGLISGMFGIKPTPEGVEIAPAIPIELLSGGVVSISNIKIGDKILTIDVDNNTTIPIVSFIDSYRIKISIANNQKYTWTNTTLTQTPTPTPTTALKIGWNQITTTGFTESNLGTNCNKYTMLKGYWDSRAVGYKTVLTLPLFSGRVYVQCE